MQIIEEKKQTNEVKDNTYFRDINTLVKPFAYERFRQALDKFLMNRSALDSSEILSQKKVDSMLGGKFSAEETELPKGIQEETMKALLDFLNDNAANPMTGEEIGKQIGLSGVTVRRYMNYLVSTGQVRGDMNYETGGRPCIEYSKI